MPPNTFTFTDLKSEVAASKQSGSGKLSAIAQEKGKVWFDLSPSLSTNSPQGKLDWLRQNKDVNKRAARDVELRNQELERRTYESIKAKLEKKSMQYEQLKRGLTGGLSEAQLAEQAVDWDAKAELRYSSDSDDEDESLSAPKYDDDEPEPMVEYTDEWGRQRTVPRSQVPLQFRTLKPKDADLEDECVSYNARSYFPTYDPSVEQLRKAEEMLQEEPLETHYDATNNVRDHGAAFYKLSAGAEDRAREMAELGARRAETQAMRRRAGIPDAKPSSEGMQAEEQAVPTASQKRKHELEERRKKIQAKRQKVSSGVQQESTPGSSTPAGNVDPEDPMTALEGKPKKEDLVAADAFLASLKANIRHE
ncbi:hypothetical protein K488DRAFT_47507 [Vararia minispora EC-137]|uniref:Uncharacterized protein n=1 Tax=Vararia minispora EC-137 TaxID=1314806 RepID=A0ACB8QPI8_9AGAM|nr:hypothetical protein K488DRAFT_47507 [Vararia minispora EC-137]